jgi:hypothetical protein
MTTPANTRIWYIVKAPGDNFGPADLRGTPKDAWDAWLRKHPNFAASKRQQDAANQAMNIVGVRLCTVTTTETGVANGTGL